MEQLKKTKKNIQMINLVNKLKNNVDTRSKLI